MSNKADKNIDPVVQVQKEANAATNAVERERLRGKPTQPVSVYADPGSSNKIENVVRAADKVLTDLGRRPIDSRLRRMRTDSREVTNLSVPWMEPWNPAILENRNLRMVP